MGIALEGLKEDSYRFGPYQAIRYDKTNPGPVAFPDDYLGKLYSLCRDSRRRSGDGILTTIFGGNPASDFGSIVSYLASRPALIIMGEWDDDGVFHEGGIAFPLMFCGVKPPELSIFGGYGFFRHTWSTRGLPIMAMLGLAYMFQEFNIKSIHGTRYLDNVLSDRFTGQFGFKQVGVIPDYHLRNGVLVPAAITTLSRGDFEAYVESFLLEQYRAAKEPVVEEAADSLNAQVKALIEGTISVVMFPQGYAYLPRVPAGIETVTVNDGPGSGTYYFNPMKVSSSEIQTAAQNGTHGKLLGHLYGKEEVFRGQTVIVQAIGSNGVVLQDSVVPNTPEAIRTQETVLASRFPGCAFRLKNAPEVLADRELSRVKLTITEAPEPVVEHREVRPEDVPLAWM